MKTTGIHSALCISTEENMVKIMEDLFMLNRVKSFTADRELIDRLFSVKEDVHIITYNAGTFDVEVFIARPPEGFTFSHLCFSVNDRKELIKRAESMGLGITSYEKDDGSNIVFIKDFDGNLYEIKEG